MCVKLPSCALQGGFSDILPEGGSFLEEKRIILDEKAMSRAITRIAYEIIEHNKGTEDLCVIGILSRGAPIGKRIAAKLCSIEGEDVPFGTLDITKFRDDVTEESAGDDSQIAFSLQNMNVVLVDDVLFTGRSVRAAFDALVRRGRPRSIQLAVLVDRGHRELPIRPDYVGKNLPTSHSEEVKVSVRELDGCDCVVIYDTEKED
jgi:pyrimidine operon attenuation protein/uracil phosphoribosyltransferase